MHLHLIIYYDLFICIKLLNYLKLHLDFLSFAVYKRKKNKPSKTDVNVLKVRLYLI